MKKAIAYNELAGRGLEVLSKGALLTSQHNGKTNTMTIGWGSFGFAWKRPLFMAMVRTSRFSHELIEGSGEFTVSIPFSNIQQQLGICGSRSGRDIDKISVAGLSVLPGEKTAVPVINTPGLHYECKVVCKQQMTAATTDEPVKTEWYADNDYHTLYFGEIVASYVIE
ncbi:MAG: flavin reductase family protein [Sporomusaceae bacterium]|nr:flavin reductase family protein [Sporomusaceae bacterium]